jgi:hypothetical protein
LSTDENQQASTFQLPLFTLQNKKQNCNSNNSNRKTFWFYNKKRQPATQLIPETLKIKSSLVELKRNCTRILRICKVLQISMKLCIASFFDLCEYFRENTTILFGNRKCSQKSTQLSTAQEQGSLNIVVHTFCIQKFSNFKSNSFGFEFFFLLKDLARVKFFQCLKDLTKFFHVWKQFFVKKSKMGLRINEINGHSFFSSNILTNTLFKGTLCLCIDVGDESLSHGQRVLRSSTAHTPCLYAAGPRLHLQVCRLFKKKPGRSSLSFSFSRDIFQRTAKKT